MEDADRPETWSYALVSMTVYQDGIALLPNIFRSSVIRFCPSRISILIPFDFLTSPSVYNDRIETCTPSHALTSAAILGHLCAGTYLQARNPPSMTTPLRISSPHRCAPTNSQTKTLTPASQSPALAPSHLFESLIALP